MGKRARRLREAGLRALRESPDARDEMPVLVSEPSHPFAPWPDGLCEVCARPEASYVHRK